MISKQNGEKINTFINKDANEYVGKNTTFSTKKKKN
jgi:hypothetical protein